ncbi:MAG: PQQ-dependent sugar dehydrogenase, partial [Ignavibacteria bacterium]
MLKVIIAFIFFISIASCNETKSTTFSLEEAFPNLSFSNPVDLQSARDGTNRLFVVEQPGRIIVFENNQNSTTKKVFLDITDRVSWGGEMGLLGLAFHPQFASNGYFYVNYTANNPRRTIISRFQVSSTYPDSADKNSELVLLTFNQPYSNHNGGCIAFGSDGYLYIASGDGGAAGDPLNNAQTLSNLLGKILQIDVNNQQPPLNYSIPPDN